MAWIKLLPGNTGQGLRLLDLIGSTDGLGTNAILLPGDLFSMQITINGSGAGLSVPDYYTTADSEFHHCAYTLAADGSIALYRDGGLLSRGVSATWTALNLSVLTDVIFMRATGSAGVFRGIDEAALWNRSLSAAEVYAIYRGQTPASSESLLAYYSFSLGSLSTDTARYYTGASSNLALTIPINNSLTRTRACGRCNPEYMHCVVCIPVSCIC